MNAPLQTPLLHPDADPSFPWPNVYLAEEDGENLETDWHRLEIGLLVDSIRHHWRDRADFYAAGNMFIYLSVEHARNQDFRGPEFFLVKGVIPRLRPYW